jgi:hypothetical protein
MKMLRGFVDHRENLALDFLRCSTPDKPVARRRSVGFTVAIVDPRPSLNIGCDKAIL